MKVEKSSGPKRTALKLWGLWLTILLAFAANGFFQGNRMAGEFDLRDALQGLLIFSALGLPIATCVTMAISLALKVRTKAWEKGGAILLTIAFPIPSAFFTYLMIGILQATLPWFLHEEEAALTVMGISWWSLKLSAFVSIIVALTIATMTQCEGNKSKDAAD